MSLYATETDEALYDWESDEIYESDESDEMEARRRRGRQPVRVARPSTYVTPRAPAGQQQYVTEAQLQAALARVGAQIRTNSTAIRQVNGRADTLANDQRRQVAAQRRENGAIRRDVRQTRELAAILPLLTPRPQSVALSTAVANLPQGERVVVDRGTDTLSSLLPILLLGGLGGSSPSPSGNGAGAGTGSEGGMDQSMLLVLALVLGQQGRR